MAAVAICKFIGAAAIATSQAGPTQHSSASKEPANPQISIVGDFALALADLPDNTNSFDFREIEFGFAAEPYRRFRIESFIGLHREGDETHLEIEEAFGRYEHEKCSIKLGKIAGTFGSVQRNHKDELNYLNYPLPVQDVFGEHGLRRLGISFSFLAFNDIEATVELFDSDGDPEAPLFNTGNRDKPLALLHFKKSFEICGATSAQLGLSFISGQTSFDPGTGPVTGRGDVFGIDFALNHETHENGRSWLFEAEALWVKPGGVGDAAFGAFGRATYGFGRNWFATVGLDYSEIPGTADIHRSLLAGLTKKVTEHHHHWRLEFERITSNFESDRTVLTLQLQWFIGSIDSGNHHHDHGHEHQRDRK